MGLPRLPLLDSLKDAVRFAPVRPAAASGVRAAIATVLPLGAAVLLHRPELTWAGLTGFLCTIVDKGGAYRTRASAMAWLTGAGAVCASLAALSGGRLEASIVVAFLAATALSMTRVYGGAASSVGSSVLILFLVSLARPATVDAALARGLYAAAGGAWAMGLTLGLWPVRVYRPARFAVGRSLRAFAAYATDVARSANEAPNDASAAALRSHRARLRQALEEARSTLAATRRGRRGDSGRGERLLMILENTDQSFGALVALSELVESARARGGPKAAQTNVARALDEVAAMFESIARAAESERNLGPIAAPSWDLEELARYSSPPSRPSALPGEGRPSLRDANAAEYALAAELLAGIAARAEESADLATSLEDERSLPGAPAPLETAPGDSPLDALRDHLTLRSAVLRHALRVGTTTVMAVWLTHRFALERGYWVTIAAVVILQPQMPATFLKAMQRVIGTVAGGLLAAAIAAEVHDPRVMLSIVFALAVVSVSLLPINYALYSTFMTPTFVLVAEVSTHEPRLVQIRIVNTLIGGVLALAGARLLWPTSERELFPNEAAAALRAVRELFHHTIARKREGDARPRERARRELGLAQLNAEASLQRWMAELRHRAQDLEAPMALLVYTRNFAAAVLTLATVPDIAALDLSAFAAEVERVLADLEAAIATARAPGPLPSFEPLLAEAVASIEDKRRRALVRARLARVVQPLAVQHDAVARWNASPR